jgi:hypothetical protein
MAAGAGGQGQGRVAPGVAHIHGAHVQGAEGARHTSRRMLWRIARSGSASRGQVGESLGEEEREEEEVGAAWRLTRLDRSWQTGVAQEGKSCIRANTTVMYDKICLQRVRDTSNKQAGAGHPF